MSGTLYGLNKGFPVEKKENIRKSRPGSRKGKLGKRVAMVRAVVRDVTGLQPYEKRVLEMIKSGASEKRMYKFCKMRLGTHRRAISKREDLKAFHSAAKAKAAEK